MPKEVAARTKRKPAKMEKKLTNFRFEPELLEELDAARYALGKPSLANLVRDALRCYLEEHADEIRAWRRMRSRHAGA